jgi:hypothetical protein
MLSRANRWQVTSKVRSGSFSRTSTALFKRPVGRYGHEGAVGTPVLQPSSELLYPQPHFDFPPPAAAVLQQQVEVTLGDRVGSSHWSCPPSRRRGCRRRTADAAEPTTALPVDSMDGKALNHPASRLEEPALRRRGAFPRPDYLPRHPGRHARRRINRSGGADE